MVTPRNYYRLMQTKQAALLFPGGVREVFHGKDEAYQLFWPNSTDFVRTAARFNATIIPLSALGAADSVNIYVDAPDVLKLPFIGERVKEQSRNVVSARFNRENEDELFTPPVAIPTIPARNYFVFGKSMSTVGVDHKDLEACATLYREVKVEVERGFEDVLRVVSSFGFYLMIEIVQGFIHSVRCVLFVFMILFPLFLALCALVIVFPVFFWFLVLLRL